MPNKTKGVYMKYKIEDLEEAISAVKNGLSLRKASKRFNVPKTTIIDHVSGRIESGARSGRKPYLPPKVEDSLVQKTMDAADKGFGVSKKQLIMKASRLCQAAKIPVKNTVPGEDWWRGLKQRHPELVLRKPEKLSTSRVRMLNKPVIESFFRDLTKVVDDLNLRNKPGLIWNADETGKQFEHTPSNVCAKKGTKSLASRTSNSRENVTILACINAAGRAMPPLCVAKGKTRKCLQTFNTMDAPDGTVWTYQSKAWMCDILGDEWFNNVFLKNCGPDRPQLLILDSHGSHEVLSLLEKAKRENIHIMALPPHCTHVLQPLDRTVFGPFNKAYNKACTEFLAQNPNHIVNKGTWPRLFKEAWVAALTCKNIKKGFEACGLFPLDSSKISESSFLPSTVYDTPLTPELDTSGGEKLSDEPAPLDVSFPLQDLPGPTETPLSSPALNVVATSVQNIPLHVPTSLPQSVPSSSTFTTNISENIIPEADVLPLLQALVGKENVEIQTDENDLTGDMYDDLEKLFQLPEAEKKATKRKKLTSHRLLTSDEVIEEKKKAQEEKELKLKAKEERERKRKEKNGKKNNTNKKPQCKRTGLGRKDTSVSNLGKTCFICLGDYILGSSELDWAKCAECKKWMHMSCIPTTHDVTIPFQCHLCSEV